jgi:hypothetical protein
MNNYGQPDHPEVAMLEELHTLWGRMFGGEGRRWPAVVVMVVVIVAVMWVVL